MKKFTLLLTALILMIATTIGQTPIPILQARAMPLGAAVTIQGTVLNNALEMGFTCYIQDATGGIAGYPTSSFTGPGAVKGDLIKVTGTLKSYTSLLEISPYTAISIISSNNPIPAPKVMAIPMILSVGDENESSLLKVNNVHFKPDLQGTLFSAGTSGFNYDIYDQTGNTMQIRVLPNTDINGALIPMGNVNIVAILGHYTSGYQLIPRNMDDIWSLSSIKLTTPVSVTDITTSSVTLKWTTDNAGSSYVKYGITPALELGTVTGTENTTSHFVTLPGTAAQLLYAKAFSVSSAVTTDITGSASGVYITASNSTGNMKVYFNTPVDHSVSTGTNAININQAFADTLISYIKRAKLTLDIAIYNFNTTGLSDIVAALNAAASKGVTVRIIYCGTTASLAIAGLSSYVHILQGPGIKNATNSTRKGIMHNKFMIIDANSADANDPLLWTGSVNWTSDNMLIDANNIMIIQDQSLARTYLVEFEEMWGSKTAIASVANAKFGSAKTNNTPHQLKVGGKWMECYFSPTDNVNVEITNRIASANTDIEAATMLITRKEMAYAVSDAVLAGASAKFLVENFSDEVFPISLPTYPKADSTVFKTLKKACYKFGDYTGGGIMHNKYLIVDQNNTASDPLVWTGSHNWSAGGNSDNDENSIVIHDATIANIYHQNFVKLMNTATVFTAVADLTALSTNDMMVYPNPATSYVNIGIKSESGISFKLQLFDLTGRLLREKYHQASAGIDHSGFDLAGMKPGIYFIKVFNKNQSYSQKLIIK